MVSVIVPAYNQAHYLSYALDSVLAQTFTDWECWIVNDGSTDTTGAIADRYAGKDARFKVIHQANQGLAGARNAGIAAARGDYLVFLDSDDGLHAEMMEKLSGGLAANPVLTGVVCQARLIDQSNHPLQSDRKRAGQIKWSSAVWSLYLRYPLEIFSLGNLFSPVCGFWRSDVIRSAGGFAKEPTGLEDFDLWLRVLEKHGPWGYVEETLVDYRRVPGSMSGNSEVMSHGWKVALQRFFQRQVADGNTEQLQAWHQIADSARKMVFGSPADRSSVPKISIELIRRAGFPSDATEAVREVLLLYFILNGADVSVLRLLKASRQDLALAHFTNGLRLTRSGRNMGAIRDFAKSISWSPGYILGKLVWSVMNGGYYPLTDSLIKR